MTIPMEHQTEALQDASKGITRVPRAAHARLLLHRLEVDPSFEAVLGDVLPDEAARLAYLNHLAWQART
mgnify:CR=1 FL=1